MGSVGGTAAATLGFDGTEYKRGRDVSGYFIVDGETETATGNGRLLVGDSDNANTSGLQLRVTLTDSQITGTHQSELTVTRGFAAQLDSIIEGLTDEDSGRFKISNDSFEEQIESIELSVDRMNTLFESKKEQLIREFAAIETTINSLQTTQSFLASQLQSTQSIGQR